MKNLVLFAFFSQCFAAFDGTYFRGLDDKLMQQGIPAHLIPSVRKDIKQRTFNIKIFETQDDFNLIVPNYPGILQYSKDSLTSLILHLFPRHETFLLANQ